MGLQILVNKRLVSKLTENFILSTILWYDQKNLVFLALSLNQVRKPKSRRNAHKCK